MPEGIGYKLGKPSAVKWKKEPRATASVASLDANDYGTGREPSSMGRQGTGGKSPSGKDFVPSRQGASMGDRNVKFAFNSNPDKPDTMPRRKG